MPVDTEVWAETVGDVVREFDALLSQNPSERLGVSCRQRGLELLAHR